MSSIAMILSVFLMTTLILSFSGDNISEPYTMTCIFFLFRYATIEANYRCYRLS